MDPSIDRKHKQSSYYRVKRSCQGTVPQKSLGPDDTIREFSERAPKR